MAAGCRIRRYAKQGAKGPTSRGLSGHLTLVSGAGEGEVVSKEVGEEVRGAQG